MWEISIDKALLFAGLSHLILAWGLVCCFILILTLFVGFITERKSGVSLLPPIEEKEDDEWIGY